MTYNLVSQSVYTSCVANCNEAISIVTITNHPCRNCSRLHVVVLINSKSNVSISIIWCDTFIYLLHVPYILSHVGNHIDFDDFIWHCLKYFSPDVQPHRLPSILPTIINCKFFLSVTLLCLSWTFSLCRLCLSIDQQSLVYLLFY